MVSMVLSALQDAPVPPVRPGGESPPPPESIPVLPQLRGLLPDGLRRGQVVSVEGLGALPLALVAGAVPIQGAVPFSDRWCGVVGMPECGVLAAAGLGADLDRLLLVDDPGERWPEVAATLLTAVDVVLLRPPSRPPIAVVRRLMALARQHGAALVVAGEMAGSWDGAQVRLRVASSLWTGLATGHGNLRGRRVKIVAEGRGAGGRPRASWLWLPGPDGSIAGAELEAVHGDPPAMPTTVADLEVAG